MFLLCWKSPFVSIPTPFGLDVFLPQLTWQFSGIHLYSYVERATIRDPCLLSKNTTQWSSLGLNQDLFIKSVDLLVIAYHRYS